MHPPIHIQPWTHRAITTHFYNTHTMPACITTHTLVHTAWHPTLHIHLHTSINPVCHTHTSQCMNTRMPAHTIPHAHRHMHAAQAHMESNKSTRNHIHTYTLRHGGIHPPHHTSRQGIQAGIHRPHTYTTEYSPTNPL